MWIILAFPQSYKEDYLFVSVFLFFYFHWYSLFVALQLSQNRGMNVDIAKPEAKTGGKAPLRATAPGSPRKGPPKFKQRNTRQFKSKPPKRGVIGFGEEIPGMEGLGTDITVICPWEAYSHLELHELAQYGII
ncbi:PREDICTED: retinal cone rhodopsin-sensitive cGMP 3',5'-cyclic phosphodiesterase subunit gamma-like isoform X1 [Poecilia mexicana]|nr:PREDICTED: retinal cone rhodopsin-sensitive cGMP 3',5'-cyclic phosphodiesterase subunit gamma-like isoform X1 [Poecilia mexicana]XP_016529042.1 PREDICTED: retinal cone rhodopsin-sensitive cGMP 3',5'-cyclic phosphodiesterase subunit gamma isoform X1 [Poecilia formosa]